MLWAIWELCATLVDSGDDTASIEALWEAIAMDGFVVGKIERDLEGVP